MDVERAAADEAGEIVAARLHGLALLDDDDICPGLGEAKRGERAGRAAADDDDALAGERARRWRRRSGCGARLAATHIEDEPITDGPTPTRIERSARDNHVENILP